MYCFLVIIVDLSLVYSFCGTETVCIKTFGVSCKRICVFAADTIWLCLFSMCFSHERFRLTNSVSSLVFTTSLFFQHCCFHSNCSQYDVGKKKDLCCPAEMNIATKQECLRTISRRSNETISCCKSSRQWRPHI